MWNYLYFIVLVRVKNKTDYTGPESYVAQMIKVWALEVGGGQDSCGHLLRGSRGQGKAGADLGYSGAPPAAVLQGGLRKRAPRGHACCPGPVGA